MTFTTINHQPKVNPNPKFGAKLNKLRALLDELAGRDLPDSVVATINKSIDQLNQHDSSDPNLDKQVYRTQNQILKYLEKELKLVQKNHYQRLWMVLGMSAFGLPLGIAFGASQGNMGFLGIGLPIGMVIGMAVGSKMDKKAADEGRQLQFNSTSL
jgi:hypothetical protein